MNEMKLIRNLLELTIEKFTQNTGMREAAMILAVQRIVEAMRVRAVYL